MRHHMCKRISSLLCLLLLASSCTIPISADEAPEPGQEIGHLYSTNIKAYVNGAYIPSYNIGGKTVIAAKDLVDYGFSVSWDGNDRSVNIVFEGYPDSYPSYPTQDSQPAGRIIGTVYSTDIKVYMNYFKINAYNIGDTTMIALAEVGGEMPDLNVNKEIGYTLNALRTTWSEADQSAYLDVLFPGVTIQINGVPYVVNNLIDGLSTISALLYYEDHDGNLRPVCLYVPVVRPAFCGEDVPAAVYGEGWKFQDGKLTIDLTKDVMEFTTDNHATDAYKFGYNASNAINPSIIPCITIPTEVITAEGSTQYQLDACIYEGEILFDLEGLSAMTGVNF